MTRSFIVGATTALKTISLPIVLAALSACSQTYVDSQLTWPPPAPGKPPTMGATGSGTTKGGPSPGAMASLHLRQQAANMIKTGRLEEAIRMLEQAIDLAPSDGQNYYYLAEAWRLKGNTAQALEFNRLAGLYLTDSNTWQKRIKQQHHTILAQ